MCITRSKILERLDNKEIVEINLFLKIGHTSASLRSCGKQPSENERLNKYFRGGMRNSISVLKYV